MLSPITLEALHILDAIERRGSFAAAANELNRAPSSLSYQIQKLEQDLDLMIFDRSGHRANFTEAGKLILERGRAILAATENWSMMLRYWLMVGSSISRLHWMVLCPQRIFFLWSKHWVTSVKRECAFKMKFWRVAGKP